MGRLVGSPFPSTVCCKEAPYEGDTFLEHVGNDSCRTHDLAVACPGDTGQSIKVEGSTSMAEMVSNGRRLYERPPDREGRGKCGRTQVGLRSLQEGRTEVAMASRKITRTRLTNFPPKAWRCREESRHRGSCCGCQQIQSRQRDDQGATQVRAQWRLQLLVRFRRA